MATDSVPTTPAAPAPDAATEADEVTEDGPVTLRTGFYTDRFDPGQGLEPVTRQGTTYTAKQAEKLYPIAAASGVTLERVEG